MEAFTNILLLGDEELPALVRLAITTRLKCDLTQTETGLILRLEGRLTLVLMPPSNVQNRNCPRRLIPMLVTTMSKNFA